jgi:hypothetical protein
LLLALALERYEQRTGAYPAGLDELVGLELQCLPEPTTDDTSWIYDPTKRVIGFEQSRYDGVELTYYEPVTGWRRERHTRG